MENAAHAAPAAPAAHPAHPAPQNFVADCAPLRNLTELRLIRERDCAQEEVRRQRNFSDQIIDCSADCIAAFDEQCRFTIWNPAMAGVSGVERERAVGARAFELFPLLEQRDGNCFLRALKGEHAVSAGPLFFTAGGWFEAHYSPLRNEHGDVTGGLLVVRDLSERKRLEVERELLQQQRAQQVELRLKTVFEQSPISIQIFAPDGRASGANRAWEELWDTTREQLNGYNILLDAQLKAKGVMPEIERAFSGEAVRVPVVLYDPRETGWRGRPRWVEAALYPVFDNDRRISEVVLMLLDVTDRKIAEVERASLLSRERIVRAEAEAANRAKDEFLAVVSHELRTPLTPILGWTRLMLNRKLGEAQSRRALEIIERNVRVQSQVIEDLLDISRIISGKLKLNARPMNLRAVIEAAYETVATAAESKSITLHKDFDPSASLVNGDPDRLQQVVWNLLSNAIKFTPRHGSIHVALRNTESHIEISVTDSGEGIAQEVLPTIFNRFVQADSTSTRSHGGLGLGLAIVRHVVELHGGVVKADSRGKGSGARFTVILPARMARPETHALKLQYRESKHRNLGAFLKGLRILAVDDEPDTLEFVGAVLEQWGAQVVSARSAAEALVALEELKPDVLISDIGMPETDGYALIRKIRDGSKEHGRDIPAIALTAFARAEDRMRVFSEGFQMHIPKPVDPAELATAVAHVAGRR